MSYWIHIPHEGDMYSFLISRRMSIQRVQVSWGNCCQVPEPIDTHSVPPPVYDKLIDRIVELHKTRKFTMELC